MKKRSNKTKSRNSTSNNKKTNKSSSHKTKKRSKTKKPVSTQKNKAKMSFNQMLFFGSVIVLLVLLFINIFLFGLFLVISLFLLLWGNTKNCPRCKAYYARVLVKKNIFKTYTKYVKRTQVTQSRNQFGEHKGSTHTDIRVPVAMAWVQNSWVCKHCGHKWKGKEHEEKL